MGKFTSFLFICVLNIPGFSQITFEKIFPAYPGCQESYGVCVNQLYNQEYVILAQAKINNEDQSLLIKTNRVGEINRTIVLDGISKFFTKTNEGGFIFTGHRDNKLLMLKTDSVLNTEWNKTVNCDKTNGITICQTNDNGYCFAGVHYSDYMSNVTLFIVRTNEQGDTLWTRLFGGRTTSLFGQSIIHTSDNCFIICGYISDLGGPSKVFLLKLGPQGDSLWFKTYQHSNYDYGYIVFETVNKGYFVVAASEHLQNEFNPYYIYLIQTDVDGDILWSKIFETILNQGLSAARLKKGGYILEATRRDSISDTYKIMLVTVNDRGNLLWNTSFGRPGEDWGLSVKETMDEGFVVCGLHTTSLVSDTVSIYFAKTDSIGNYFPDSIPATNLYPDFMIFPNPVTDKFTISVKEDVKSMQISNIQGKIIYSTLNPDKKLKVFHVNLYNQASGMYIIKILTERTMMSQKLIKL